VGIKAVGGQQVAGLQLQVSTTTATPPPHTHTHTYTHHPTLTIAPHMVEPPTCSHPSHSDGHTPNPNRAFLATGRSLTRSYSLSIAGRVASTSAITTPHPTRPPTPSFACCLPPPPPPPRQRTHVVILLVHGRACCLHLSNQSCVCHKLLRAAGLPAQALIIATHPAVAHMHRCIRPCKHVVDIPRSIGSHCGNYGETGHPLAKSQIVAHHACKLAAVSLTP
jgi:hypothetical protein